MLRLIYGEDFKKSFDIEITIAPGAERYFTQNDPKTRSEFFNHALEHALKTAWIARELKLLDAKREIQPSPMLSELTGQRTYLLSGSKVFGQAIKERMVLGYIENQMSARWEQLEEYARMAKTKLPHVSKKGVIELMKAKEHFLRGHQIMFNNAKDLGSPDVAASSAGNNPAPGERALPDAMERFYIALWESLQEAPLIAPTSGSYGISCFQIINALRTHLVKVGGHEVPLLVSNKSGGPVAFVPALGLGIMPLDKFGHLHHSCFNAGCSTTDHIVEWQHRGARDIMALLKAQAVQGIFAPTNPKSVEEIRELLTTAMDQKELVNKTRLNTTHILKLIHRLETFAQKNTWREDLKNQRPIQLPPDLRRELLDLEVVSDKQIQNCLQDPNHLYSVNRNSHTNEEIRTFRSNLVVQHNGVLKAPDNFDLFFSPKAQKALNHMGVRIYDRATRGQKKRLERNNFNVVPGGLDIEITQPIEAGLYGLMVPRLQHLEEMLAINEELVKTGGQPIKELVTYNQPSVGATLAAAALTDWIVNSGVRLSDKNKKLLQDLFPHIAEAMDERHKDKKEFPIKLTLTATPDTATLHPGSLARELGYQGPAYNNDGMPANGLGTLTPGQLPLKVLQQCMSAKEASFKKGGVYPAPDALMEIGRMFLFVTNIHAQVLKGKEIASAQGLNESDPKTHDIVASEAEKARYPEEAAAASLAGYMLQMINGMAGSEEVRKYAARCANQLKTYGMTFESMKQLLPKSGLQQLNEHARLHGEPLITFLNEFLEQMKHTPQPDKTFAEKNISKTDPDRSWKSRVRPAEVAINEGHALTFYDTGRNGPEVSNDVRMEIRTIIEHMKETGVDKPPVSASHGRQGHVRG